MGHPRSLTCLSFPRKRESSSPRPVDPLTQLSTSSCYWMPACAGMTSVGLLLRAKLVHALLEARRFVLRRQHFGPLGQSLAAASRVAATVAGAPASRLAAEPPKLEQPRRQRQVGFSVGGCRDFLHSSFFASYRRKPVSSSLRPVDRLTQLSTSSCYWMPAFAGMTIENRQATSFPRRVGARALLDLPCPRTARVMARREARSMYGSRPTRRRAGTSRRAMSGVLSGAGPRFPLRTSR